jgi:16S rRNA G966 N2-methylase RsmD
MGCNAYRFFPLIDDSLREKLQIDEVGMYSISTPKKADIISRIILDCLQRRIPADKIVITDAMAGVGGNVISFAKHFGHVNAVEIEQNRFKYMINNVGIFKCHNISALNLDYINVLNKLKQDVIFMDPPWGGKQYKEQEHVNIMIGTHQLNEVIQTITQSALCRLLVLKLPTNYDIDQFKDYRKVKVYDLKKMLIVLIYCKV